MIAKISDGRRRRSQDQDNDQDNDRPMPSFANPDPYHLSWFLGRLLIFAWVLAAASVFTGGGGAFAVLAMVIAMGSLAVVFAVEAAARRVVAAIEIAAYNASVDAERR